MANRDYIWSLSLPSNSYNTAIQLYNTARDAGASHINALYLVGSAYQESGFNPFTVGDGGTSHGLMQVGTGFWNQMRNQGITDPAAQMQAYISQMQQNAPATWDAMNRAGNVQGVYAAQHANPDWRMGVPGARFAYSGQVNDLLGGTPYAGPGTFDPTAFNLPNETSQLGGFGPVPFADFGNNLGEAFAWSPSGSLNVPPANYGSSQFLDLSQYGLGAPSNPAPHESSFMLPPDSYFSGGFNPAPFESGFTFPGDNYFGPAPYNPPPNESDVFTGPDTYTWGNPAPDNAFADVTAPDTYRGSSDPLSDWNDAVAEFGYGNFYYDSNGDIVGNPGIDDAFAAVSAPDMYRGPGAIDDWNDAVAQYGYGGFGYDANGNIVPWDLSDGSDGAVPGLAGPPSATGSGTPGAPGYSSAPAAPSRGQLYQYINQLTFSNPALNYAFNSLYNSGVSPDAALTGAGHAYSAGLAFAMDPAMQAAMGLSNPNFASGPSLSSEGLGDSAIGFRVPAVFRPLYGSWYGGPGGDPSQGLSSGQMTAAIRAGGGGNAQKGN